LRGFLKQQKIVGGGLSRQAGIPAGEVIATFLLLPDAPDMDWKSIFAPDVPLLDIVLRGSLTYISIFFLLRVVLKRQTGSIGMTDILLITLLADAAQNGMADDYKSFTAGFVLVATIIFWNYAFDWLAYRFTWFSRLIEPTPLLLVRDGRLLRKNMRKELITEDELMSQLRLQGLDDPSKVKEAYMESDGQLSVVQKKERQQPKKERKSK
jgi:uncharacterized membrane protein YcaP (DUF421 family)